MRLSAEFCSSAASIGFRPPSRAAGPTSGATNGTTAAPPPGTGAAAAATSPAAATGLRGRVPLLRAQAGYTWASMPLQTSNIPKAHVHSVWPVQWCSAKLSGARLQKA
eukprot:5373243-Pyramimonas_sp.AAC.1